MPMWKFGKKKKDKTVAKDPNEETPTIPAAAAPMNDDDDGMIFAHPGAFGGLMLPSRRRSPSTGSSKKKEAAESKSGSSGKGCHSSNGDEGTTAGADAQKKQQHPLCSDSTRIDDVVSKARLAKQAEEEAAALRTKKEQLDRDIQRLERDKADMTESHLAQLEKLRQDLEADARDGQRRLESELEKGHAKSMDRLRLTLKAETDSLAEETKRLREDLQRARQARAAAGADRSGGSSSGLKIGEAKTAAEATGDTPVLPMSAGFWNSLNKAFSPRDLFDLGNDGGGSGDDGVVGTGGGRGGGGGVQYGGNGSVPPPALLVLAAVPLFCFYMRWRTQKDNHMSSEEDQTTDGEIESEREDIGGGGVWWGKSGATIGSKNNAADVVRSGGASTRKEGKVPKHRYIKNDTLHRPFSSSPLRQGIGSSPGGRRPDSSLRVLPRGQEALQGQEAEALISPSVVMSRATPSSVQRPSVLPGSGRDAHHQGFSETAAAAADIGAARRNRSGSMDSVSTGDSLSGSQSPEWSDSPTRASDSFKQHKQQQPQKTQYKKKKPLLLPRTGLQPTQRVKPGARPAPRGLKAAANTAAARTTAGGRPAKPVGGAMSATAASVAAARTSGADGAVAGSIATELTGAAGAVTSDSERTADVHAMSKTIEDLRTQRDSLKNACGRLEADREAAMVQLRENAERVRKLKEASNTLSADKNALEEKCASLQEQLEGASRGEGQEGRAMDEVEEKDDSKVEGQEWSELTRERARANTLQVQVVELERERCVSEGLVSTKERKLAQLEAEIKELHHTAASTAAELEEVSAASARTTIEARDAKAALDAAVERGGIAAEDAARALAEKEEEADRLRARVRDGAESKQILGAELAAAVAERERMSAAMSDLQRRVAEQEKEANSLKDELTVVREAAAAAEASAADSQQVALSETRAKLAAVERAFERTTKELEEAQSQLNRLEMDSIEQQRLFEAKVAELDSAVRKISMLEECISSHLDRQRGLEDELEKLRRVTEELESSRDALEAEANAKLLERNKELEALRARTLDLSSKLENSEVGREEMVVETDRLRRELDRRCRELEAEKQAQADEYEQRLSEKVAKIKAIAFERDAKVKEREVLDTRHAEELHALEEEKASLRASLEDRYASASEELRALSSENRRVTELCSGLREDVREVEERARARKVELKVMTEKRDALCLDIESSRARHDQVVENLTKEAESKAAVANASLSRLEKQRLEENRQSRAAIAEKAKEIEEMVAASRAAEERSAEEAVIHGRKCARLAEELENKSKAKIELEKEAAAITKEKEAQLKAARDEISLHSKEVTKYRDEALDFASKYHESSRELQKATVDLSNAKKALAQAVEDGRLQEANAEDAVRSKEKEIATLRAKVVSDSASLDSLRELKDKAEATASRASARAEALKTELGSSAKLLAEVQDGYHARGMEVVRLTRVIAESQEAARKQAAAAAAALEDVHTAQSQLEKDLDMARREVQSTRHELCAAVTKATAAEVAEAEAAAAGAEGFEQASKELACAKDRVAKLEGEEEERERSLKKLEEQVKCMKESHDALSTSADESAKQSVAQRDALESRLKRAHAQIKAAEGRREEAEARAADCEKTNIERMHAATAAAKFEAQAAAASDITAKEEEIRELTEELDKAREAAAEAEEVRSGLRQEMEVARAEVLEAREQLEVEKATRAEELAAGHDELKVAREEVAEARKKADSLQHEVEELEASKKGTEEELTALRCHSDVAMDKLRAELQSKTDEVTAITERAQAASADSMTELDRLRREVEAKRGRAESELAEKEGEASAMESRVRLLEGKQASQAWELERVVSLRDSALEVATKVETHLAAVSSQLTSYACTIGEKEEELSSVEAERNKLGATVEALTKQVETLMGAYSKATEELAMLAFDQKADAATADDDAADSPSAPAPTGAATAAASKGQGSTSGEIEAEEDIFRGQVEIIANLAGTEVPNHARQALSPSLSDGDSTENALATLSLRQPHETSMGAPQQDASGDNNPILEAAKAKVEAMRRELDDKSVSLAKAEEKCLVLEARQEDFALLLQGVREDKEKLLAEFKRKRDKVHAELKEARAGKRSAEKRCLRLEAETVAICDDYEERLQQQVFNHEAEVARLTRNDDEAAESGAREAEVDRLKFVIEDLEAKRKETANKLKDIVKHYTETQERSLAAIEAEKSKADRLEQMLEASRKERDAECESLQKNIDSQKAQLDVKVATVKHLWEKVAAIRRVKAVGNEDLKAQLDEALAARESLSTLVENQQEQIDRLRRRAKRKEEEITKTVLARLRTQGGASPGIIDEDELNLSPASAGEGRDSLDSAKGSTRGATAALRSQLAEIKAQRADLLCKCQLQEQQIVDLRRLLDEIGKLESNGPDIGGDINGNWETQSFCSDVSGMSLDSSAMPRGVEDIPEKDLRELTMWFKTTSIERRRLLKRYNNGRLKTKDLAAMKEAGGDMFASARGMRLAAKGALARSPTSTARSPTSTARSPTSDTESVKSGLSARSGRSVHSTRSGKSASTTPSNVGARPGQARTDARGGTASRERSPRSAGAASVTGAAGSRQRATTARGGGGHGGHGGRAKGGRDEEVGREKELRSSMRSPRAVTRAMGGRTGWI